MGSKILITEANHCYVAGYRQAHLLGHRPDEAHELGLGARS